MTLALLVSQLLNGIAIGMLYAVAALGLSIIKGLLNIPNFAHGAFYAVGAYLLYAVVSGTDSFWLGLVVAALVAGALGALVEWFGVRRLYGGAYLFQLLLLFGVSLVVTELLIVLWGPEGKSLSPPEFLQGALIFGGVFYPKYLLFTTVAGAVIIVGVWLLIERTRYGAVIRAGIEKTEMVSALGINIERLFTLAFAFGAALAGLAGALAAPIVGVTATMGLDMLAMAFVVLVIGGLGSLYGAVFAGLLVGVTQSLVALYWPSASTILIYVAMVLILLWRPQGLLGER